MNIITAYATQNPCYKAGKKMVPSGIVVHSTGCNNPNLSRYVDAPAAVGKNYYNNHWNTPNTNVCVHSFIGYDANKKIAVANILPYNFRCWGVGSGPKGSFNNSHIQFEICEDALTDANYFKKVWNAAVEYCAYLCKEFSFDPLGENVIVGHYEAHALGYGSNHGDPRHWFSKFGKTMDDFRTAVKAEICGAAPASPSGNAATLYRVQTGAFSKKTNAEAQAKKIKAAGFDAIIVQADGLYKIQVGAFSKKENAENMAAKLRKAGYDNYITTKGGEAVNSSTAADAIKAGSSVKVRRGAKTYTGAGLAPFVYTRVHKVSQISGDRAVITYNGVIVAAVKVSDLIAV